MKARITLPDEAGLTAEARAIRDDILSTRGDLRGPFLAWLHSPGLADPAQKLGAFCRYGTGFAPAESELVILLVAHHFDCPAEWTIHAPIALANGIAQEDVERIARGEPICDPDPRRAMIAEVVTRLLADNRLDDRLFAAAETMFGAASMVELVGIVGYYAFAAMTLNAFAMEA